jgi:hypothetical protein
MKKYQKWLYPAEAEWLGLKVRNPEAGREQSRYYISKEQYKKVVRKRKGKPDLKENTEGHGNMSAFKNGRLMDIDEYCAHYNLPLENVKSYKIVTHTGIPYYNILFNEQTLEDDPIEWGDLRDLIEADLLKLRHEPKVINGDRVGVVKIADLHFGAYVNGLIRTKDYSIGILVQKLHRAAAIINSYGFASVHVHILGDLIETFTGLNHKNSWKNLDKVMIGAEVVKLCTLCLHKDFLNRINNLSTVKIVAGNHDRVTSNKDEDTKGDAANLIAWGLDLMGYDVEFDPLVISHFIDEINHVILHGHHGISKKETKAIILDYGKQGVYNLIAEGHLHSIIERLTENQKKKFHTVKDDAVDHRRFNAPSFFTGNSFSEYLGYTSASGFVVTYNSGLGVPDVDYKAV